MLISYRHEFLFFHVYKVAGTSVSEDRHLQSEFVTDAEGRVIVDFVGRFERLAEDFAHVCRTIGVEAELPHVNPSRHADYRTYYSDHSRALVAEHFAEDIERFGYRFGA